MDFKEVVCEDGNKIQLLVNTIIKSGLLIDLKVPIGIH
jgi:hypothetical protein